MQPQLLNALALPAVILLLMYSGVRRKPGIGILISLVIIAYTVWSNPGGLARLGLQHPRSWPGTVGLALLLGPLLALASTMLLEPAIERITGHPHDISVVNSVRGSLAALLQWLLVVWILVALLEEIIFRGYLLNTLVGLIGTSALALTVSVLLTSAVFGLAHAYQGPSGVLSTGVLGTALALIYLLSGFNLWLVILTHGLIDTVQLALISANLDQRLRMIKSGPPPR